MTVGRTGGRQHRDASRGDVEDQQRLRAVHDRTVDGGHAASPRVQKALHLVLICVWVIRREDGLC